VRFHKYQGTGNDFILLDNRQGSLSLSSEKITTLCDRRFGIGADGLILIETAPGYDFGMKYFNADGNESTMCGNGGRCITAFADFLSGGKPEYNFKAIDGPHKGIITERSGQTFIIKLQMGNVNQIRPWGTDLMLNTGSPHLVRFVKSLKDLNVFSEGRLLRNHADFIPGGLNVNFVEETEKGIFVRTYERGVEDETLSCGTGVTASALAFASGKIIENGTVHIETRGGNLKVHYRKTANGFSDIWLEGPAEQVFEGVIEI